MAETLLYFVGLSPWENFMDSCMIILWPPVLYLYEFISGPHTWAVHYPLAAGDGQSPVNISTDDVIFDSDLTSQPLTISYKEENDFQVENTGSSFKVNTTQISGLLIYY